MNQKNLSLTVFIVLIFLSVLVYKINHAGPEEAALQSAVETTSLFKEPGSFVIAEETFEQPFQPPSISAGAAVVEDLLSGKILFEKNSRRPWPMASLSKLMSAVLALEKIGLDQEIIFSEKTIATEGIGGWWQTGDRARAEDLIKTMLVVSSNDAAAAIAEHYGEEKFLRLLNDRAEEIGLEETFFNDPTGLSLLNQSRGEDLRLLGRYIYFNFPELLEWSRLPEIVVSGRKLLNINEFAGRPEWLGGKTGFTDESGGNLISFFNINSRPVLIIILGAEDRFGETKKIYNWLLN